MPLMTLDDIAGAMTLISDAIPDMSVITLNINATRAAFPEDLERDMTEDERRAVTKALTAFAVRLSPDVSCYPIGLITTLCFDENGDVIP